MCPVGWVGMETSCYVISDVMANHSYANEQCWRSANIPRYLEGYGHLLYVNSLHELYNITGGWSDIIDEQEYHVGGVYVDDGIFVENNHHGMTMKILKLFKWGI